MQKKILYISPFEIYPPTTGGSRYIYNYIKHLSKENTIIFIGLKNQKKIPGYTTIKQYNIFNTGVKKYSNIFAYREAFLIAQKEKPDEIIVAMPYQIFFGILLAKIQKVPCSLHEQNIEFLRFKRLGKWWWPVMYFYEKIAYSLVDKILYISETDKHTLIKNFNIHSKKLTYSPYIVDPTIFKENVTARKNIRQLLGLKNTPVILFFGPLDYQPNKEAVALILTKIAPYVIKRNKKINFLIAGKNPPKDIIFPHIIFTGFVDKIEDYINASDIVIVPLLSGGGVRTKILESLACKKPVVSTSIGAEGIIPNQSQHLIIQDDFTEFAKSLILIIKRLYEK